MRKMMLILFGLVCCLFFAVDSERVCEFRSALPPAILSVDRATTDQWCCEREYNSDLNLPRVIREVAPTMQSTVLFRSEHSIAGRVAMPHGGHGLEPLKVTSEFESSNLFAGPHAVDYYVYRLRRLII